MVVRLGNLRRRTTFSTLAFRSSRPHDEIAMAPSHPCPNCGQLRSGPDASCVECLYPKHKRQLAQRVELSQLKHPPLQFHIRTLIAVTAVAAIACAITKRWGIDGLWLAIEILAIFFPAIEFFYYFWINLRSSKPNAIDEYENRFW
jgi:hypothetical protein